MKRYWPRLLLIASMPALGGCVASIAASAVGMAVRGATAEGPSNANLGSVAEQACSARAAQYGIVHIIDVEHRTASRIIVWGSVTEGETRRSFQCDYGTRITDFKLREIRPRS